MKKIISILFILCGIFSSMAYAQGGLTYSGTVIGEDGLELIGVSVAVKGTSIGVITDLDGKFRLNNIPPKSTVVFSYVGFENKEVKVTESKERETIVLKQSISSLDEVVVVGRGSQRKVSVVELLLLLIRHSCRFLLLPYPICFKVVCRASLV